MDSIKPGYETTEFWGTIFVQLVGLFLASGLISPSQASAATAQASSVGGIMLMLISLVSYIVSRTQVKRAYATADARLKAAPDPPPVVMPAPVYAQQPPAAMPDPEPWPDSPPAPSYHLAPRPPITAPITVTLPTASST